ncbi:MAG TPA: helix-turn-helix transcriptional regulator [Terriglobia bacterium]|nr:helix-turn-helix transcriptional regulator [Terriglobia bacterium]
MQIAVRIRQVRLKHSLSLEDLAAKAGLSKSLLASFENGQDVPSLETFDRLAEAVGVSLQDLFYDDLNSNLTPRLTPRLSLQQLIDEYYGPSPSPDRSGDNRETAQ